MKLYEGYPESVEFKGRTIDLDLDFRTVLRVFDLGDEWTEREKLTLSLILLLKNREDVPDEWAEQLELLTAVFGLFPKKQTDGEKYLDLDQDADLIRSAFFRIGVDLCKDKLHFFRFLELLADLPTDTALMRTIEIRQRKMPKPTAHNQEERAALAKAKARVAIKMTDDERRKAFAKSLRRVT